MSGLSGTKSRARSRTTSGGCSSAGSEVLEVRRSLVPPEIDECELHSPFSALTLYHRLWTCHSWTDCYTLLASESRARATYREFVDVHCLGNMRIEPSSVRVIAPPLITDKTARFYCEATMSMAYPQIGKMVTRFVRTLVREEDGTWRPRWRKPGQQSDLGQVLQPQLSRRRSGIVLRLDSVILLENSTMILLSVNNSRRSPLKLGTSRCRMEGYGRAVRLRQSVEVGYGARECEPGEELRAIMVYDAVDPQATALCFSPELVLGETERWRPRFRIIFEQQADR